MNSLNNKINKINKTGLIIIVLGYILILSLLLALLKPSDDYLIIPNYQHQFYNDEISPQISVIGNRTFDSDGEESLKYSIQVVIAGRGDTSDPHYKINNFRMSASTKANISDTEPNKMYYFTEHTSYTTQITHTYTVDNTTVDQHPSTFYVKLRYSNGSEEKITSFKEDVWLEPLATDIEQFNQVYENRYKDSTPENNIAMGITKGSEVIGALEYSATENKTDGLYLAGVRIKLDDRTAIDHVDMQSWILTADGEYLPFIGVYNYTSERTNFSTSSREINKKLNPTYICVKLKYFEAKDTTVEDGNSIIKENSGETFYYMQRITNLPTSFKTTPNVGDVDSSSDYNPVDNTNLIIAIVISVVTVFVIIAIVYVVLYTKKKNTNKKVDL